jgi:hypothetical protein
MSSQRQTCIWITSKMLSRFVEKPKAVEKGNAGKARAAE